MKTPNALNWFEIYTADLNRARTFYEAILQTPLVEMKADAGMPGFQMIMFPFDETTGVGGALIQAEQIKPGPGGTLVYLNVEGDLDGVLSRIPKAGGQVIRGRFDISPHGYIGIFSDSEGNVVGLHSMT